METKHTQGKWNYASDGIFDEEGLQLASLLESEHKYFKTRRVNMANGVLMATSPELLKALVKANEELKSIIEILDGRITPELAKTDLGIRLVSFFNANAFICEEKIEPIIQKATN